MVDTAEQLLRVVVRLSARGHTVVEVPGWQTRGSGPMTTRGRVEHHTVGPPSGDTPSLRVVTFGRPGLRNSLSRWYVSRSGVIYLVALRVSWHAGVGVAGTNATLSGTEAENTGVGEPWAPASLAAQAAISEEEAREFGFPAAAVVEHREHAPGRKIDRTGIDGPAWRARIAAGLASMRPPDAAEIEEDEMRHTLYRDGDTGMVWLCRWGIPPTRTHVHPDALGELMHLWGPHRDVHARVIELFKLV